MGGAIRALRHPRHAPGQPRRHELDRGRVDRTLGPVGFAAHLARDLEPDEHQFAALGPEVGVVGRVDDDREVGARGPPAGRSTRCRDARGGSGTSRPTVAARPPAHAPAASTTTRDAMRPCDVSTPATRSPSITTRSTRQPPRNRAPSRRAAARNPEVVPAGSAYPEPGSYAATPMSSVRIPGTRRFEVRGLDEPRVDPDALLHRDVGAERGLERGRHELHEARPDEAAVADTDAVRPVEEVRLRRARRGASRSRGRSASGRSPDERPVAPAPTLARSTTRTSAPRRARWNARLAPWTPAPTMTMSAVVVTASC